MNVTANDRDAVATTYAYRPSITGAGWQFRLDDDAIAWDMGRKSGRVPYRDIQLVRMSYRPLTMQTHRFVTEVFTDTGPRLQIASTSWKSLVEQERRDGPYTEFVRELHRRLPANGGEIVFVGGAEPIRYWAGFGVFVVIAVGLAGLVVRALQYGVWGAAGLIVLFLAWFLFQVGNYFRRNRPVRYRVSELPANLLP